MRRERCPWLRVGALILWLSSGGCEPVLSFDSGVSQDASEDGGEVDPADAAEVEPDSTSAEPGEHDDAGSDANAEMDAAAEQDGGVDADATSPVDEGGAILDAAPGEGGNADATPPPAPRLSCADVLPSGETLLDLGEGVGPIIQLELSGQRLLTQGIDARWKLWDTNTWRIVAHGSRTCEASRGCIYGAVALAGPLLVLHENDALEVRSSSDGQLLGTIPRNPPFGVASDGSYIWTATSSALETWSSSGTRIVTRPGSYAGSRVWASGTQLKVGNGPAGPNVVELVSATDGQSSTSAAFTGNFFDWFDDGRRFLTVAGSAPSTVRVYSEQVVEQASLGVPVDPTLEADSLGGYGDYFWYARPGSRPFPDEPKDAEFVIDVYRVGGSATPVFSRTAGGRILLPRAYPNAYAALRPTNGFLYLLDRTLDLRGPELVEVPRLGGPQHVYAVTVDGAMFGANYNMGFGRRPSTTSWERLNCGPVLAAAPGSSHRWAFAFRDETIVVDVQRREIERVFRTGAEDIQLSSDDALLRLGLSLYRVSSGELVRDLSTEWYAPWGRTMGRAELAKQAPRIAETWVTGGGDAADFRITDLEGTEIHAGFPRTVEIIQEGFGFLSPSGRGLAVAYTPVDPPLAPAYVDIYRDGEFRKTVRAFASGWLDDTHFLASTLGAAQPDPEEYMILDDLGDVVARPPLHGLALDRYTFDALEGGAFINTNRDSSHEQGGVVTPGTQNVTIEVATGSTAWASPVGYLGRANDRYVVYWGQRDTPAIGEHDRYVRVVGR